jgi:hypothetical protein
MSTIITTIMLMAGDMLALITVMITGVVIGGLFFSAVGRIKFSDIIQYWIIGLILSIALGFGIWVKANDPTHYADPNGWIFGFSNDVVLGLWGLSLFLLFAALGLIAYIINK